MKQRLWQSDRWTAGAVGLSIALLDLMVDRLAIESTTFAVLHVTLALSGVALVYLFLHRERRGREQAEWASYTSECRLAERRRAEAEREQLLAEYDWQRRQAERLAVEARLRAEEFEAIIAAMTDAVIVFDTRGVPQRVNPATIRLYADSPATMGSDASFVEQLRFSRADWIPLSREELPWMRALRGELVRDEPLMITDRKGHHRKVLISASPLAVEGNATGVVAVCHDLTAHERLILLEERQRLARELHDSLSQTLYSIGLGTHTARIQLDRNPTKVLEALDYVIGLADAGLAEMRGLIFQLRPESLAKEGLVKALRHQANGIQRRHSLPIHTTLCEEPEILLAVKEALYRIAQEALHNVAKHAHAQRAELWLTQNDQSIVLEVYDNGIGFDPDQSRPGHLGLRCMRERASTLNGRLEVHSRPGQGTHIRATLPKEVTATSARWCAGRTLPQ